MNLILNKPNQWYKGKYDQRFYEEFYDPLVEKLKSLKPKLVKQIEDSKFKEPDNHIYIHRNFFLNQRVWDMPKCQNIGDEFLMKRHNGKAVFVSHRWMTPGLPDIGGRQLMMIKDYLKKNPEVECVWYDYMCMPQKPRSEEDDLIFKDRLTTLNDVMASCPRTYILHEDNYMSRSWCKAELFMCSKLDYDEGQGTFVPEVVFDFFLIPCLESLVYNKPKSAEKMINEMLENTKVTNGGDKEIIKNVLKKFISTPSTAILFKMNTILTSNSEDIARAVSTMSEAQINGIMEFFKKS